MKTSKKPVNPAVWRRRWLLSLGGAGVALVSLVLAASASAQVMPSNIGMYDDIASFYIKQSEAMEKVLQPMALRLFGLLAVISMALFWIRQLLAGEANITAMLAKFGMEILKLGFFMLAVTYGPTFMMQFLGYFTQAGMQIGQAGTLSPSGIVVLGFDACFRTFDAIGAMGWGDTAAFGLPLALCGIGILACFSLVAILFLIRMIELHLVIYGGVLLLGFGGVSFTRDIPKNYLSYGISAGVQVFMLYVVIGMGMLLAESWPQSLTVSTTPDDILRQVLQLFVASAVFAAIAWTIPKVAASVVSGSVSLGVGDAVAPAVAAGGMATMGATVATGGASTLAAAAQGAMQATTSGVALAKEQGSSGIGAALKGLGHAASATASEAGRSAQATVGLKPPSANATDSRGRGVESFGTRAANNLQQQIQTTREARASSPIGGAGAAPTDDAAKVTYTAPAASPAPSEGTHLTIGGATGLEAGMKANRNPTTGNEYASERPSPPLPRLRATQLPPDTTPPSAVSIRLDTDD